MSAHNGNRSRFHRDRKRKILCRKTNREVARKLAAPAANGRIRPEDRPL